MEIIKKVLMTPITFIKIILRGFYYLCLTITKGFYFYFVQFFKLLKKIFHFDFLDKTIEHFKKRQGQPESFLLVFLYLIVFIALYNIFYPKETQLVDTNNYINNSVSTGEKIEEIKKEDNNNKEDPVNNGKPNYQESNLFRRYAPTSLENVNFDELTSFNSDTVAWLSVDGTNINYPITKTIDNDYYLSHSYDKSERNSGWTFMDYRNNVDSIDKNTIIYGHNLLNKTGFGSLVNLFTTNWFNNSNRIIILLTREKKYFFKIYSIYTTTPEVYYLQTEFYSDAKYQEFIDNLNTRSTIALNDSATINDKILTLSTCTEDNAGRKVVHAKLISEENR